MIKICQLLNLRFGFIGAQNAVMLGKKYTTEEQYQTIRKCGTPGLLDTAVVSVSSGKNGTNLKGMNWMVALGPIAQHSEEEQCQGNHLDPCS